MSASSERAETTTSRAREIKFEDIAGLQIIAEEVSGESTYYSYELDLVLREPQGQRVNVMDHGKGTRVQHEAEQLAELLGVPVWI